MLAFPEVTTDGVCLGETRHFRYHMPKSALRLRLRRSLRELSFDLETAIRVCRQIGYFEHASYLTEKYERYKDCFRI